MQRPRNASRIYARGWLTGNGAAFAEAFGAIAAGAGIGFQCAPAIEGEEIASGALQFVRDSFLRRAQKARLTAMQEKPQQSPAMLGKCSKLNP